jgi:hypothetical protein
MFNFDIKPNVMIEFDYVNWKGKVGRRATTITNISYGSNEYHPEEQWLLTGFDHHKEEYRTYAMKGISNVQEIKI